MAYIQPLDKKSSIRHYHLAVSTSIATVIPYNEVLIDRTKPATSQ